jgi:predicted ATP-grasp superfamily ATP-dependent carboligase
MTIAERSFDTSVPAVVLKLTPNVMHHGGLGVIRSLGRAGITVYGVHESPASPVANSRYLAGRFFWSADPSRAADVKAGLARIADRVGGPAVLLPVDDAGALFLAEHGDELRPWFLFPAMAPDLPRRLANKHSLYELCRELGMPSPEVCLPGSVEAARGFADGVGYPLIAKLATPWLPHGTLPTTALVLDADGLNNVWRRCAESGIELMLQEFIPGGADQDWFFHGYCDSESICRLAFTGVKERSFPVGAGSTTYGRSAANGDLSDQITGFLKRTQYSGIMDLDIRLDARNGQYNLLDFNPRLGAQFRVFRDTAGIDVALAAYLDLTGQGTQPSEQVNERRFMVESYDPRSAFTHMRRGDLSLKAWLSSVRAVDEFAWFARDDLRPFGLMCLRMTRKTAIWPVAGMPWRTRPSSAGTANIRYRPGRARGRLAPPPGARQGALLKVEEKL